ncbi:kinase-like protein [Whalleya microplaca]|nr:kinase-like protein [Whalleya microplaca]
MYNKGGHHPVNLGDVLGGRFDVVHKLGNGGFSIVWLCRDTESNKWRAVKIMSADHSGQVADQKIYDHLQSHASLEEIEEDHIAMPLELFWIDGPNGRHCCLVMPVFGWSASTWRLFQNDDEDQTGIDSQDVCHQVIQGLRFLHGLGICHGDLKPDNVLMRVDSIDELDKDQIYELMGEPDEVEVETESGAAPGPRAPEYCVIAADGGWCKKVVKKSIVIIDFGEAFFANDPPSLRGMTHLYAAPEVMFQVSTSPGFHSDIWSLACTIFEIRTLSPLFASSGGPDLLHILRQVKIYLDGSDADAQTSGPKAYSDDKQEPIVGTSERYICARNRRIEGTGFSDIFEATLGRQKTIYRRIPNREGLPADQRRNIINYRYPKEEVLALADLLRKMLKYDPAERISLDEVARHPWMSGRSTDAKSIDELSSQCPLGGGKTGVQGT